jgi:hypothetical protein
MLIISSTLRCAHLRCAVFTFASNQIVDLAARSDNLATSAIALKQIPTGNGASG